MKESILIAGGSGLVGNAIIRLIDRTKYDIIVLSRTKRESRDKEIKYVIWDTVEKTIDLDMVPDHIINLAGVGIADTRWTLSRKQELITSRVDAAKTIGKYLTDNNFKPKTYMSASAIGYYGDRGNESLLETSAHGSGFLSDCCQKWEMAAHETGLLASRMVIFRIGIVLSMLEGALPKMLMTRNVGIYNYFGDGGQMYSWIHIDDLCRMMIHAIENSHVQGIYNAVAPEIHTNKEFVKQTMIALESKGILLPAPTFILRIALGEMADIILNSTRVISERISKTGFTFLYGNLQLAIKDLSRRNV